MTDLNSDELVNDIIDAIKTVVGDRFPAISSFAQVEARAHAAAVIEITRQHNAGEINDQQAEIHLRMAQRSAEMALTAAEGMSLALAEAAVKAAIDVIRKRINAALGVVIL
jgi:hypothetical protein